MILGIEWVVHRAIGLFFISEFKAWNVVWFAENSLADEDNNGDYDRLVDGVSENVSPHDFSNNGSVLVIWLSLKNGVIWWLSSQSKSGEGIHDQVNPEHLNGSQWGFSKDGRSSEDNEHSNNVDGKLELKELSNVIIDVSSEFKSNNNGGEVIIQKNDITGTFGDISTGNSHSKSNIGLGQSWGIIGTITCYGDNTFLFLNTSNENKLVLWGRSSQNFQVLDNFDEFLWSLTQLMVFLASDGSSILTSPPTVSLKSFPVMQVYWLFLHSSSVTIPAFLEIAMAVSMLSPVHMMVVIPAVL